MSAFEKRVRSVRDLFDPGTELPGFSALSGDELTNEARRKENTAQYQAGLNDSPDCPQPFAFDEKENKSDDSGNHTNEKQRGSKHSKKKQRFFCEAELEP